MGRIIWVPIVMLMSLSVFSDLAITSMRYDQERDQLVIGASFPGKCLPHELSLTRVARKAAQYTFRLSVSNEHDPCNAINETTAEFSLSEVLNRPAELLVSFANASSPAHRLKIPVYPNANITKVTYDQATSTVLVKVKALGKIDPTRFYIDIARECSGRIPVCEALLRDKLGFQTFHGLPTTKDIRLKTNHIRRPATLMFRLESGGLTRIQLN